jgi:plasmid stabilization system protein ParE
MTLVTILDETEAELREAVGYYEDKRPGLGLDFARAVETSVESVRRFPVRWPVRDDSTRRYLIQHIPYIVVYLFERDQVWVIAVAHCKRQPGYWSERISAVR